MMPDLTKYAPRIAMIIGAAMAVHRDLNWGLEEAIYQESLSIELSERNISWQREVPIHAYYHGKQLKKEYYADFMCDDILLELKAVRSLITDHRMQLFNYMRLTQTEVGVLINFGERSLRFEKYYLDKGTNEIAMFH